MSKVSPCYSVSSLKTEGGALWSDIRGAETFFSRLVGLLGTSFLDENAGIMISPCSSVHTVGMKMNIDIVFLDKKGVVAKIARSVRPYRFLSCRKSVAVIEVSADNKHVQKLAVGDQLTWERKC